jgi:hypothetical protein
MSLVPIQGVRRGPWPGHATQWQRSSVPFERLFGDGSSQLSERSQGGLTFLQSSALRRRMIRKNNSESVGRIERKEADAHGLHPQPRNTLPAGSCQLGTDSPYQLQTSRCALVFYSLKCNPRRSVCGMCARSQKCLATRRVGRGRSSQTRLEISSPGQAC